MFYLSYYVFYTHQTHPHKNKVNLPLIILGQYLINKIFINLNKLISQNYFIKFCFFNNNNS